MESLTFVLCDFNNCIFYLRLLCYSECLICIECFHPDNQINLMWLVTLMVIKAYYRSALWKLNACDKIQ